MRAHPALAVACCLLALALVILAPQAPAQSASEGCRSPLMYFQPGPSAFQPGEKVGLLLNVENPNDPPADSLQVTLKVRGPEGWRATASPGEFAMSPRGTTVAALSIVAPPRGAGAGAGTITVEATAYCVVGNILSPRVHSSATMNVGLAPAGVPWTLIAVIAGALAALVGGFALYRWRTTGLRVRVEAPFKELLPGKGVSYSLIARNGTTQPDKVRLTVGEVPPGWTAHLAVPEIDLEAKEERSLWLLVRPPADARDRETVAITVAAASTKRPHDVVTFTVRARVDAEPHGASRRRAVSRT